MATYKEKVGTAVTNNAGAFPGAADGELWFNSTASTFQYQYGATTSAWSTGGNLNTAREEMGGVGIKTAALAFGGESPGTYNATEEFNTGQPIANTWQTGGDLNTAKDSLGGAGTSAAGLAFGGNGTLTETEVYNGTNWTEVNDLNSGRNFDVKQGLGTSTAALACGGFNPSSSPQQLGVTESYNGSAFTEENDLNTARGQTAGGGTTTAALALTETWDGTSWTETADMNTARNNIGGSGTSSTSALAYFGQPPPSQTAITESWDGTSWTEVADGATPRAYVGSAGTASSAQINGGEKSGASPYYRAETEEFNKPDFTIKSVTTS
jgi:hypothetical protein